MAQALPAASRAFRHRSGHGQRRLQPGGGQEPEGCGDWCRRVGWSDMSWQH